MTRRLVVPRCPRCSSTGPFGVSRTRWDGRSIYCRACKAEASRLRRAEAGPEHRTPNLEQRRAEARLRRAVAAGQLAKLDACIACGGGPTEAHHHNGYGDHWWDVQWLCRSCHALAESAIRDATAANDDTAYEPLAINFVGDWL